MVFDKFCEGFEERDREMLEVKATLKETDMPIKMQAQAMASASHALDLFDVLDCVSIASHIKKEFDKMYGEGWQCVVGSNFSCFFTQGCFIYFSLESLNFLIFKSLSQLADRGEEHRREDRMNVK